MCKKNPPTELFDRRIFFRKSLQPLYLPIVIGEDIDRWRYEKL